MSCSYDFQPPSPLSHILILLCTCLLTTLIAMQGPTPFVANGIEQHFSMFFSYVYRGEHQRRNIATLDDIHNFQQHLRDDRKRRDNFMLTFLFEGDRHDVHLSLVAVQEIVNFWHYLHQMEWTVDIYTYAFHGFPSIGFKFAVFDRLPPLPGDPTAILFNHCRVDDFLSVQVLGDKSLQLSELSFQDTQFIGDKIDVESKQHTIHFGGLVPSEQLYSLRIIPLLLVLHTVRLYIDVEYNRFDENIRIIQSFVAQYEATGRTNISRFIIQHDHGATGTDLVHLHLDSYAQACNFVLDVGLL
ncbi:unnamed protein product [Somion occarium]|uniref:Uncharacterized protein n=1 Tax=Somion occarium TaxID=3059160 RepID=A0ABP1DKC9_9APHY